MKIALAGCGGIGEVHAKCLKHLGADIVFCDPVSAKAGAFSEKYGGNAYSSLESLLENEKVDSVHITSPHYTHVPLTLYALSKGLHVFMEKPAAHSPGDMKILVSEAEKYTPHLGICFQNRYASHVIKAKELLSSGEAGRILGASAFVLWSRFGAYYSESSWRGALNTEGGGVLINQSIHTLDLMLYLLGEPEEIYGSSANHLHKGITNVEDAAEGCLVYPNGVHALFYASNNNCIDEKVVIDIICENMRMKLSGASITITKNGETTTLDGDLDRPYFGKSYWGNTHGCIIKDFYDHINNNLPFPIDAKEGSRALAACFKIMGKLGN